MKAYCKLLEQKLPVCSHRSYCSFLSLILKRNHSVGTHVPGPGLDLIKRKLKKILLQDREARI